MLYYAISNDIALRMKVEKLSKEKIISFLLGREALHSIGKQFWHSFLVCVCASSVGRIARK